MSQINSLTKKEHMAMPIKSENIESKLEMQESYVLFFLLQNFSNEK